MDMELVLYRAFQEAGLPAPNIRVEVPVGDDPNVVRWFYDLVCYCGVAPRQERTRRQRKWRPRDARIEA